MCVLKTKPKSVCVTCVNQRSSVPVSPLRNPNWFNMPVAASPPRRLRCHMHGFIFAKSSRLWAGPTRGPAPARVPHRTRRTPGTNSFLSTLLGGSGSVVGIATGYGLDGPGVESRRGRDFPHLSRPALGLSLLCNRYRVFPGGKERPGRDADTSPPSSAVVMKQYSYTSTPPMGRTACTEPQCLYKGALYLLPPHSKSEGTQSHPLRSFP